MPKKTSYEMIFEDLIELESRFGSVVVRAICAAAIDNHQLAQWKALKEELINKIPEQIESLKEEAKHVIYKNNK